MTGAALTFATTSNWGSGFGANITLSNGATSPPLSAWQLAFDFAPDITGIWNANILSHQGTRYTIGNADWNGSVAPGSSVTFGFNAAPGGTVTPPTNVFLNGKPLGGDGGTTPTSASIGDVSVASPSTGSTATATFAVTLSSPASAPFSLSYSTADVTAHSPSDYLATSGTLHFAAGQSALTIPVTVNPLSSADSRSFSVTISNPSDPSVTLTKASAIATISARQTNAASVSFQVVSDWGSGYTGSVTITNKPSSVIITDWALSFDYAGTISSIWNASVSAHSSTGYTIKAAPWNNVIAPGASVSFGFNGAPGGLNSSNSPTNFALTESNGGAVNLPPTAGNIALTAVQGAPKTGIALLTSASSPSGFGLTVSALSTPLHGTASLQADFSATYTSSPDYTGTDSFTYTVDDGHGGKATGTVSVTVNAIPPPNAPNFAVTTPKDAALTIDVLSHASDDAGFVVSLSKVGDPAHGTAAIQPDSSVLYTPATGYVGMDSVAYTVSDGKGRSSTGAISISVVSNEAPVWPAHVFAPFTDQADWPIYDFVRTCTLAGTRFFNLGFIVSGPNNSEPSWGAYPQYDVQGTDYTNNMKAQIAALRALGGDVAASFGGALNRELADTHPNLSDLQAAYQLCIDTYDLYRMDFDIEGADVGHRDTLDLRSAAMAGLQQTAASKGRTLQISLTLPVLPTGLTQDGVYVVQSALNHGVVLSAVNIMAMYYGAADGTNPNMAGLAIQAARSTFMQLRPLYPKDVSDAKVWALIGITPLLGINEDIRAEVFVQEDAQALTDWAKAQGIGMLSCWSANRDHPGNVAYNCSGVNQAEFDFQKIMNAFTS